MLRKYRILILLFFIPSLISLSGNGDTWITEKRTGYQVYFTQVNRNDINDYNALISNGIKQVNSFFRSSFKNDFAVYIHPHRHSLDSTWQKDWNMPGFKSECWMVASGVGSRLDMISPKKWDTEACEHRYGDSLKTQQIVTHELFHVFHGQLNMSSDFSNTEGIDWFVEGLATYASGQCDSSRLEEVKKAISEDNIPASIENFWTGKLKYSLSGSLVMFIDSKYGRTKLNELLLFSRKSDILAALKITEPKLLNEWEYYIHDLK